jgi:DNA primase
VAGRIADASVEELRSKADIVEVVSGYLQLKKAGRIFKGLCCFHQEKTPSFTVDPAKQLFYCFGCGAGGDVFTFLRELEGLSFTEAAEQLAGRFGVNLVHEGGPKESTGIKGRLKEACREASGFFSKNLMSGEGAAPARSYLEERGFTSGDAESWGLGFAPSGRDALYRHLVGKKFSSKEIVDAGLALVDERGGHRDRFRGRLIFPIADLSGQVVGFGARALGDVQPKYLNSPETPIYHKGRILYGLDRAKTQMARSGSAIVSEGYTDVMGLHQVDVMNAVATCGTALREDHFALIKRFCERVVLAFDADPAGDLASERGFAFYAKTGVEVLVAPLPEGKDPADVALSDGAEAVNEILERAEPLMRFVLKAEISRYRLDTPEDKARAVRSAAQILSREPSPVARGEHAFWVAGKIGIDPVAVQIEIAEGRAPRSGAAVRPVRLPGHVKVEREALAVLLDSPSRLAQAREWLTEDHFTQQDHRVLWKVLMDLDGSSDASLMSRLPDDNSRRVAAELALTQLSTKDQEQIFTRLEEFRVVRKIVELKARLDALDPKKDVQEYDSVFAELLDLENIKRRIAANL